MNCPFCNSFSIERIIGKYNYCHCANCGADGPVADTVEEAVRLWDARPREEELKNLLEIEEDKEPE